MYSPNFQKCIIHDFSMAGKPVSIFSGDVGTLLMCLFIVLLSKAIKINRIFSESLSFGFPRDGPFS